MNDRMRSYLPSQAFAKYWPWLSRGTKIIIPPALPVVSVDLPVVSLAGRHSAASSGIRAARSLKPTRMHWPEGGLVVVAAAKDLHSRAGLVCSQVVVAVIGDPYV